MARKNSLKAHEQRTRALMAAPMAAFGVLLVALPLIYVLCTSLVTGGKLEWGMGADAFQLQSAAARGLSQGLCQQLAACVLDDGDFPAGGLSLRLLHGARAAQVESPSDDAGHHPVLDERAGAYLRLEDPFTGQRPAQRHAPLSGADSEKHQVSRFVWLGAAGDGLLPDFLHDSAVPQRGG